jgi:murein DD-endopeptidase MepM/ murein hydrolase activator NlpD
MNRPNRPTAASFWMTWLTGLGWGSTTVAIASPLILGLAAPLRAQEAVESAGAEALQIEAPAPQAAPEAPAPAPKAPPAPIRAEPVRPVAPPVQPQVRPQVRPQPAPSPPPAAAERPPLPEVPTFSPTVGAGTIDSTKDYDLGATRPTAPSEIQFSQRGKGCTATANGAAIAACGPSQPGAAVPPPDATGPAGSAVATSAGRGGPQRVNTGGGGSAFGGAPVREAAAIRIGPLSLSTSGVSLNTNFFFRSERPRPVQGNGDRAMLFPLTAPAIISSSFGWRTHPILGYQRFHAGSDIAAPMGTPVVAPLSGRVTVASFLGGYGLSVVLSHGDGTKKTLYAHLSETFVKPGEVVRQGDVIGRVGSTGLSTGPHLHFEVREYRNGQWMALNPKDFLKETTPAGPLTDVAAATLAKPGDLTLDDWLASLIAAAKESYVEQYDPTGAASESAAAAPTNGTIAVPTKLPTPPTVPVR